MVRPGSMRRREAGFSFVETLVAMTLMTIGFLGFYASLHASARMREAASDTNIAVFKLQSVVEHVFSIPFDDVTSVFPDGQAVDITALVDSLPENDFRLLGETITVTYDDPAAEALHFKVAIAWDSRLGGRRAVDVACVRAR